MARPTGALAEALRPYVGVRVVDMAGVDLDVFAFDTALTFAVLLMNADGTVYHRYGAGDGVDSEAMLSEASFLRTLADGLEAHAAYGRRAKARRSAPLPDSRAVRTVEDLPPMRRRLEKGPQGCIHCHTVGDMRREWAEEQGTWRRDDVWRHPPAKRLGVTLDRDDQRRIAAVADASAAAEAGLRPGDRLTSVAGTPTAGEADVRFALDRLGPGPVEVPIAFIRGGEPRTAVLALSDGWRRGDALDLSWRNDLWPLRPNPGFGGKALTADEKRKLDLPADRFALRVGYLIDFGPHPEDGRAAKAAGLRVGDVVRGISGAPPDFVSERHFQAWWRLHVRPGATVVLDVTSTAGVRREVRLTALP